MSFHSFLILSLGSFALMGTIYGAMDEDNPSDAAWLSQGQITKICQDNKGVDIMATILEKSHSQCLRKLNGKKKPKTKSRNLAPLTIDTSFSSGSLTDNTPPPQKLNLYSPKGSLHALLALADKSFVSDSLDTMSFNMNIFPKSLKKTIYQLKLTENRDVYDFIQFCFYFTTSGKPYYTDQLQGWLKENKAIINKNASVMGELYHNILQCRAQLSQLPLMNPVEIPVFLDFLAQRGLSFNTPAEYGAFWELLSFVLDDSISQNGFATSLYHSFEIWVPLYEKLLFFYKRNSAGLDAIAGEYDVVLPPHGVAPEVALNLSSQPWDPALLSVTVLEQLFQRNIEPADNERVFDWLRTVQACLAPDKIFSEEGAALLYQSQMVNIDTHCDDLFTFHDGIVEQRKVMAATSQRTTHSTDEDWAEFFQIASDCGVGLPSVEALASWLEDLSFVLGGTLNASSLISVLTKKTSEVSPIITLGKLIDRLRNYRQGTFATSSTDYDATFSSDD